MKLPSPAPSAPGEVHHSASSVPVDGVEAVEIATRALVGAAEHGNDIQAWLDAAAGGTVAFSDHDHRRHGEAGRSVGR